MHADRGWRFDIDDGAAFFASLIFDWLVIFTAGVEGGVAGILFFHLLDLGFLLFYNYNIFFQHTSILQ